jgi:formylglycine-generating enzyme required for sulfatase activity
MNPLYSNTRIAEINRMDAHYAPLVLRLIMALLISALLFSCGGESSLQGDNGAGVAFRLKWPVAKSVGSVPAGVVKVRILIYGADMGTMFKDFDAAEGTGTITGVPAGSGRTITFQGLDASPQPLVLFRADIANVTLVPGVPRDFPNVQMVKVENPVVATSNSGATGTSISGTITSEGAPLAGVTVTMSGGRTMTATTASDGTYSFSSVQNGTYTLTPGKAGYIFKPATLQAILPAPVTVNGANLSAMNFSTIVTTATSISASAVSSSQINLTWLDFATTELGYKIERKMAGGSYTQIAVVSANVTTYKDAGLTAATTYYYRVRATAAVGDSGYTDEARVTTLAGATVINPVLIKVTGGTFVMGDVGDGTAPEPGAHQVTVSDFYLGKYEVTQQEWFTVMGSKPSTACNSLDCPVETVNWNDIQDFIATLNRLSGKIYRLPTEAEWEYAARDGGQKETYSGGNDVNAVAWYAGNAVDSAHPVGQKQGNTLGLCDMSGNVYEWVGDWYAAYSGAPQVDPVGPVSGAGRVVRGGGWNSVAKLERTTYRVSVQQNSRQNNLGFRLVLSIL